MRGWEQDLGWLHDAACADKPVELFFSTMREDRHEAQRICGGCPVSGQCLQWSVQQGYEDGVFGGQPPRMRDGQPAAGRSAHSAHRSDRGNLGEPACIQQPSNVLAVSSAA